VTLGFSSGRGGGQPENLLTSLLLRVLRLCLLKPLVYRGRNIVVFNTFIVLY
jgi:hypothetical protein